MKVDVAVVGAGPSGSSVAKHCAEKGLDVLIIEKRKHVGFPPHCAGYVSKLITKYFRISKTCIQQTIEKMRTYSPSGCETATDMHGWIVERGLFDKSLCLQALEQGVDILINSEAVEFKNNKLIVREIGKNRTIKIDASYIIGADGASSRVARWIGAKQKEFAKCAQYEVCGVSIENPKIAETYFSMEYASHAYAWIYPTGKNSAKIGLGTTKGNPSICLNSFIKNHPIAREKLKNARIFAIYKGLVPVGGMHEKIYSKNILLVGDAAGVTDPISGAGILSGITTGKLAAQAIADENPEKYEVAVKKLLGKRLEWSLKKREILNKLKNDEELEKMLPKIWIAFKDFWSIS